MPQRALLTWRELLRHAFRSTSQVYDRLAGKFEQTPFRTPDHVLDAAARAIAQAGPFDAVLDLGCGTGAASRAIRGLCRRVLVGVDLSHGMLREARQRWAPSAEGPRLLLCQGDALAIPTTQAFDMVTSFGMFMHIEPRLLPAMVAQVAAVLKPTGRFVFITSYAPSRLSGWYWLARAFNGAMRIRNWLHSPPMVLYYMGFTVPRAVKLLRRQGFRVDVRTGLFRSSRLALIVATKNAVAATD